MQNNLIAYLQDRKSLFERLIDRAVKSKNNLEFERASAARSEIDATLAQIKILKVSNALS